ncbi:hypothetical protein EMIT0P258_30367 [Pseudomonas sp. IT-P258]
MLRGAVDGAVSIDAGAAIGADARAPRVGAAEGCDLLAFKPASPQMSDRLRAFLWPALASSSELTPDISILQKQQSPHLCGLCFKSIQP